MISFFCRIIILPVLLSSPQFVLANEMTAEATSGDNTAEQGWLEWFFSFLNFDETIEYPEDWHYLKCRFNGPARGFTLIRVEFDKGHPVAESEVNEYPSSSLDWFGISSSKSRCEEELRWRSAGRSSRNSNPRYSMKCVCYPQADGSVFLTGQVFFDNIPLHMDTLGKYQNHYLQGNQAACQEDLITNSFCKKR